MYQPSAKYTRIKYKTKNMENIPHLRETFGLNLSIMYCHFTDKDNISPLDAEVGSTSSLFIMFVK